MEVYVSEDSLHTVSNRPYVFGGVWIACQARAVGIKVPLFMTLAIDVACSLLRGKY